jgi:SAM-dependent methyltransferase
VFHLFICRVKTCRLPLPQLKRAEACMEKNMKIFSFLKYFFYLSYNWNIRIAWFITRCEIRGEKKYGINTTGADELKHLEKKGIDLSNATIYMPAGYNILENLFERMSPASARHFIDIGCGKGRALCVAAHYGAKKLTGIDFSKKLCMAAENNLAVTKKNFPGIEYQILNNDAFYFEIPVDADFIFLFNPFDEVIMNGVAENILESYEINPRHITIFYLNPLCKDELLAIGFKETYHIQQMKYLEAVILEING